MFQIPTGSSSYNQSLNLQSTLGIDVQSPPDTNIAQRQAQWTFTAIDPTTGQQVSDPCSRLLPPNDANNDGEGFVTYEINPVNTATTGTQINAQATVVFDTEPPINTPKIFNTLVPSLPPVKSLLYLTKSQIPASM